MSRPKFPSLMAELRHEAAELTKINGHPPTTLSVCSDTMNLLRIELKVPARQVIQQLAGLNIIHRDHAIIAWELR